MMRFLPALMVNNNTGIQAWVFDVDDTLYKERDYVHSGFKAVGTYVESLTGIGNFAPTCSSLFRAGRRKRIFNEALEVLGFNVKDFSVPDLVAVYRAHTPDISVEAETLISLLALKERYKLALITGGPEISQRQKVSALELSDLFEIIIYSGRYGTEIDKPHPWAWESIERQTGFGGSDLVYIGDNPTKDFQSPLELGWQTCRVKMLGSLHHQIQTPVAVPEAPTVSLAIDFILKREVKD